jgi:endonuclease/exonuclease/phosphatase family metal-dependent hydrolase
LNHRVVTIAGAWILVVLALLAIHVFLPQRSGVIALTEVFEPYFVVSGLVAAAVALITRAGWAVVLVAVLVISSVARYGPTFVSLPSSAGDQPLQVVTWNVLVGDRDLERIHAGLAPIEADLVGLLELQSGPAKMLARDAPFVTRYPYRVLVPDTSVLGVGLLSRHPIVEHEQWSDPPLIRAVVTPAGRSPISVYVAHPLPCSIQSVAGLPVALDTAKRDQDIAFIRSMIDRDIALGRQVVVLGDLNITERDPAYRDLTTGLRDAHLDAGIGPGLTWRPPELLFLPFGLLRIDFILTSSDLAATSTHVECSPNSDHCLLVAELVDR